MPQNQGYDVWQEQDFSGQGRGGGLESSILRILQDNLIGKMSPGGAIEAGRDIDQATGTDETYTRKKLLNAMKNEGMGEMRSAFDPGGGGPANAPTDSGTSVQEPAAANPEANVDTGVQGIMGLLGSIFGPQDEFEQAVPSRITGTRG
jgi:hypothetical protein